MNIRSAVISITIIGCCSVAMRAQSAPTPTIPTVEFCDLVRKAADYDGKQVRTRATYFSGFEMSSLGNPKGPSCDAKSMVWAEFDQSIHSESKPEIIKRFLDSIYARRIDANGNIEGEWVLWETPVVVTGVIHKPNGRGYGHTNIYSHEFVVSSIEEVGEPKKTDFANPKKQYQSTRYNKSLDASGGSVFRKIIGPAMLE